MSCTEKNAKKYYGIDLKEIPSLEELYKTPLYGFMAVAPGQPRPDFCEMFKSPDIPSNAVPPVCKSPAVSSGASQKTTATRFGANISNHFQFNNDLGLTLNADFEKEELDENVDIIRGRGFVDVLGIATSITKLTGPRSGKRRVWGADAKIDWQATDKLNIQAGIRYDNFTAEDTVKLRARANKDLSHAFGWNGFENKPWLEYLDATTVPVEELVDDQAVIADYKDWASKYGQGHNSQANKALDALREKHHIVVRDAELQAINKKYQDAYGRNEIDAELSTQNSLGQRCDINTDSDCGLYRRRWQYTKVRNGKIDTSRLAVAGEKMFREKVANPNGDTQSKLYKYLIPKAIKGVYVYDTTYKNYLDGYATHQGEYDPVTGTYKGKIGRPIRNKLTDIVGNGEDDGRIEKPITDELRWNVAPAKISGHAWSPMLAFTYDATDNHRFFARISHKTRFPSIYEATGGEGIALDNYINLSSGLRCFSTY